MGLILDSSVVIAAERRGNTHEQLVQQVISVAGNQEAARLSVEIAGNIPSVPGALSMG
jgi:hypothetical protein